MATFNQVKAKIQTGYDQIWHDWYLDIASVTKAQLDISISVSTSGYSHSNNIIYLCLCEGNFDDKDILDDMAWPIWKRELVHEMLHEYQEKVQSQPTPAGILLYSTHRFFGNGHDERFFSVVVQQSSYFNVTPADFIKML